MPIFEQNRQNLSRIFQNNTSLMKKVGGSFFATTHCPSKLLYLRMSQIKPVGVIAEWVQPLGAMDAYQIGIKVAHNSKTWENIVNNNVWEPGVYGWNVII